jgi:hypothetical protein
VQLRQNFQEQKKMSACADILTSFSVSKTFTVEYLIALVVLVLRVDRHRIEVVFVEWAVLPVEVLVVASSLLHNLTQWSLQDPTLAYL